MRVAASLWQRVGRRGTTLLFLATLDFLVAGSLLRPPAEAGQTASVRYIADLAPLPCWGALWAAVGVACLIGAFLRVDRWAYAAAMALKVLWGMTYLLGWALFGLDRAWVSAVVWLAFAAFVYVVSTWPEPPVTKPIVEGDDVHFGGP